MKTKLPKTERLHSLDSLRAIMMLLGLVIHSAVTYGVLDLGKTWIIKDPKTTSLSNDFIAILIHTFRMPIFFIVAGFFGAMLFYERKPLEMIKNRVSRIVYPFLVFVLILWPIFIFAFNYTKLVFLESNTPLKETLAMFSNSFAFIPKHTFHLWFLYYLSLITGVSVLLALILKKSPKLTSKISKTFNWLIQKPIIRIFVFSGLTFLIYLALGISKIETSASFIPSFNTFIFYFFFYIIGWILFKSKHQLVSLMRLDWVSTILGMILFLIYFLMNRSLSNELIIILSSLIVWLFIFGITGLFIRYASKHSLKMRYISDASYWVYLIHLPLTAIIPSFLVNWEVPSTIKFLTVLTSTITICFVSYNYFVRNSFIGKFLNGKKYSKKTISVK